MQVCLSGHIMGTNLSNDGESLSIFGFSHALVPEIVCVCVIPNERFVSATDRGVLGGGHANVPFTHCVWMMETAVSFG